MKFIAEVADTQKLTQWAAYFPTDLLITGMVGSAIMATMIYTDAMDKAADPANPRTPASVFAKMVRSFICGLGLAIIGGGAFIDWMKIENTNYRLLVGGGLGFFGVKITEWLMRVGFPGLMKLIGKPLPDSTIDPGREPNNGAQPPKGDS